MSTDCRLDIYLHPPILLTARNGKQGFINRLTRLLQERGWQVEIHRSGKEAREKAPDRPGYALFNMERPTHSRALTFRLAYHFPFWRLEKEAERWRWPVARARFDPSTLDHREAHDFAKRLRKRVLPGPEPRHGDYILVPLQGQIRKHRSFQVTSPIEMLETVARTGRPTVATLHPNEDYDTADHAALRALIQRYPKLSEGEDTARLLRDCAFVATQNSAVAFDGYILGKPAVLFAQADFHHIALNVADLGAGPALAQASSHRPDFDAYLDWFLRRTSLDMMAPDADERLLQAMRDGGWPV